MLPMPQCVRGWRRAGRPASLVIEWLRICLRHGWIGNHPIRNHAEPKPCVAHDRLPATRNARRKYGLDLPYGPAAHHLGLASTPDLPKARRRGRPPDPPDEAAAATAAA